MCIHIVYMCFLCTWGPDDLVFVAWDLPSRLGWPSRPASPRDLPPQHWNDKCVLHLDFTWVLETHGSTATLLSFLLGQKSAFFSFFIKIFHFIDIY